ncbi:glycosyl transferase family 4-domain-containing protein [Schizophyllum commune]
MAPTSPPTNAPTSTSSFSSKPSSAIKPRPLPTLPLLSLLPIAAWLIARPFLEPVPAIPALYTCLGFSIIAFVSTIYLVPALAPVFRDSKVKLYGRDLLKVPESLGLVCAAVYISTMVLFIPFAFSSSMRSFPKKIREGISITELPLYQLSLYLSSLLSILIATMLGFLDDLFDIRWRHKIPIPIIASIPLLTVYYAERGNTQIVVPLPLRGLLGTLVNLGPLYYLYMSLLSTFATNSINILAGINGSEVSQALIIALSVILNDLLYLPWPLNFRIPLHLLGSTREVGVGGVWSAGMAYGSRELVERHLFSLYFMLPLVAVCLGFVYHNWYPARVFPGDTLCYVTGMTFAVVGIQAHFSKTLLLFFIPQIFNFLLSCPQLFGIVPCPRHRVPEYRAEENILYPSRVEIKQPVKPLTNATLRLLAALRLTRLTIDEKTGAITHTTNLTILNFFLVHLGPLREDTLVKVLMTVQVAGSVFAFVVRYVLAGLVYDGDRR